MAIAVHEYFNYLNKSEYPALFGPEDLRRLSNVEQVYGNVLTNETILEVCLSKPETGCDYSIKVDAESQYLKEYWYELDSYACDSTDIAPCYFVDAGMVRPGTEYRAEAEDFYEKVLIPMAGTERVSNLKDMLDFCVDKLEGKNKRLFQVGVMTGRQQLDSIRFFTAELNRNQLTEYLTDIGWTGDVKALDEWLCEWEAYSDKKEFILDFDVFSDHISEKIGICFGTKRKDTDTVKAFLNYLKEKELCLNSKSEDVIRFINEFPSHTPFIQNDISHFKLPFADGKVTMAKAYLRQNNTLRHNYFRAFSSPMQMNLELTTRCPLRCPQCYCELTGGKDMSLETALYWIDEAAENNVIDVNLSGGETLLYPHIMELIRACHEKGMVANVALSGYGVTRNILQQMIDAGVGGIYISLNGSTKEINQYSRDGYELAVCALDLLKEMEYKKTVINWVMHSTNADDFENMIHLAEKYNAAEIAVMVFKPDSKNQLPSVPTREQMERVAKIIKSYNGVVKLEVESCFSQMRALVGKKLFVNFNQGITKGCGAGRDCISVSVDGRLTPCRHLELEEEFTAISEYWIKSDVIKELRTMEDKMKEPCSECCLRQNCLPCMAVNLKMNKKLYMGNATCPIR